MRVRRPASLALIPCLALMIAGLTAGPAAADPPDYSKIRISEVKSDGSPDFVELTNTGSAAIDISTLKAVDSDPAHTPIVFAPASTTLEPGAYFSFAPDDAGITGHFGLGSADSITILQPDGTTVIDTYSWTTHRTPSYQRCGGFDGAFTASTVATPGAANTCPPPDYSKIKINEVSSNPNPDFVELTNTGSVPIDISTLKAVDSDPTHSPVVFAPGTTIQPGGYFSFDPDSSSITGHFGLGAADSITIFQPDGTTVIDTYSWTTHRTPSFARCPNGTGDFAVTATATPGAANECAVAPPSYTSIKLNEVESNGDKVADWVELTNTGASAVDISGWKILDNDPAHVATPVVVPAGTSIAPGGYYAIYTEIGQTPGFGLGGADSATVYLPDGTTVVDTYSWLTHAATTYGRCPNGTGDFKTTTTSTRGAGNACSPVRINEIESSDPTPGPDWVELTNISADPVDISGWVIKDSTDVGSYTFPVGSTLAAHAYQTVDFGGALAGLGGADSVRLFGADGTTLIESYSWTTAATVTYGRCKDGLGDFVDTTAATKGAANSCPGLATEPWPGSQTVATADLTETFTQDLSGLAFDPANPDVLWGAQNKHGTLFKLVRSGQNWIPDTANGWGAGKDPKYTDGTGAPDTEGLTIGPDGDVYMSAERDNSNSGVSRMSVLRYDPNAAGATLTATDEWNLTSQIPAAGANLGLEGVAWVPDSYLVGNGFIDQSTGQPYNPADYPLHGTGLYFVAVEDTGNLYAFALDSSGGTSHKLATISSGFAHLADVNFDPERQRIWAVTDDTFDGKTSQLKIQNGAFVIDTAYDRPAGMANLNNEGLAIAPQSRCVAGKKEVLWADDGDDDGHSLRTGTIDCTAPVAQNVAFTTTAPSSPVVGQTYAAAATGGGSGNAVVLSASPGGVCALSGGTVTFAHAGTCTVAADQAAAQGFSAGSASQHITIGRASTTTQVAVTPTTVVATVDVVAPGVGAPSGDVEFRVGTTTIGTAPLTGDTATLSAVVPAGADRSVTAVYPGDTDFTASVDKLVRHDPLISSSVQGTLSSTGWYTSPVTISYVCTPAGAPLLGGCPDVVTLSADGADQSVTRTVMAINGGEGPSTVDGIDIDRTKPTVAITGVTKNKLYVGSTPKPKCTSSDATSGIASCVITRTVTPLHTTLKARAVDNAGNSSTTTLTYKTLGYVVRHASYKSGQFVLTRGKAYHLDGTVKASGRVYGPARIGSTAQESATLHHGSASIKVPRSATKGGHWKVLVKVGSKTYTIKITVAG
ncbi:MAG: cell wall protein [Aeromicrobium sp.]|nr:cell wall protein [Aeromicrobium sp.]